MSAGMKARTTGFESRAHFQGHEGDHCRTTYFNGGTEREGLPKAVERACACAKTRD
jgi:hypothetical protein